MVTIASVTLKEEFENFFQVITSIQGWGKTNLEGESFLSNPYI